MNVTLTDDNERLIHKVWKEADRRSKEANLPSPTRSAIINGLVKRYCENFLATLIVPKPQHTRE